MNEEEAFEHFNKCLLESKKTYEHFLERDLSNKELYGTLCLLMAALEEVGAFPDGFENQFPKHVRMYRELFNHLNDVKKDPIDD